jgi:malonyl-ACP O-methyltransferase BioC
MNYELLTERHEPRLLLIFAGWSTNASAFAGLSCPGYDIGVLSNMTNLRELPLGQLRQYSEIVVMAWSMGVWAAAIALEPHMAELPVTLTLAVNGTPTPADNLTGIPTAVFSGTAQNLNQQTLAKFRRRMGGAELPPASQSIEQLQSELFAAMATPAPTMRWDRAVISRRDMIFPPANQHNAWQDRAEITEIEGTHTPQWQPIIDAFIINKSLVQRRFHRSAGTYRDSATVQQRIAGHLWDLWQKYAEKEPIDMLELGYGTGMFTELYTRKLKFRSLQLWDMLELPTAAKGATTRACDAEIAVRSLPADSVDAVASASTMQWFNSPAAFLQQVERALKPGGLAVLSTFGPDTFGELTAAGVTPLPYMAPDALRRIVTAAGLEPLELHSGTITLAFDSPLQVLRHLQATGVNARPTSASVHEIIRRYPLRAESGDAELTYQPIYLIARKPE